MSDYTFDAKEFVTRIFKYFFEGLIVAIAAYLIPGKKMLASEIVTIGVIAAATFATLDLLAPSIGASVRTGVGIGIGTNITGLGVVPPIAK